MFWDKYILSILWIGLFIFNLDLLLIIGLILVSYSIKSITFFVWNCVHHTLFFFWTSAKKNKKFMCLYCHLTWHLIFFVFCTDSHNGYGKQAQSEIKLNLKDKILINVISLPHHEDTGIKHQKSIDIDK